MATKTISVDLVAYEALRRARLTPKESFSQVIRRAQWSDRGKTCGLLLESLPGIPAASEETLRHLDDAQTSDAPPEFAWS